ncbi:DEAD/DEAH box helicase [Patescibacteria group bacterium]|nr:DEAD/DEAH box helicase [Patescibacteria group bacterium]
MANGEFFKKLLAHADIEEYAKQLLSGSLRVSDVSRGVKEVLLLALAKRIGRPSVVITSEHLFAPGIAFVWPAEVTGQSYEVASGVAQILGNKSGLHLVPPDLLSVPLIGVRRYDALTKTYAKGQEIGPETITKALVNAGYDPDPDLERSGTFYRTGGSVRVWGMGDRYPHRLDWVGDRVETINRIEASEEVDMPSVRLFPASITDPKGVARLRDYIKLAGAIIAGEEYLLDAAEDLAGLPQLAFTFKKERSVVQLPWSRADVTHNRSDLHKLVKKYQDEGWHVGLARWEGPAVDLPDGVEDVRLPVTEGVKCPDIKWIVFTPAEILTRPPKQTKRHSDRLTINLKPGQLITHRDHGVGKFRGLVRRKVGEVEREYLFLEYAKGDKLYVPVSEADKVDVYVGPQDITLTRLSSASWEHVREKVKSSTEQLARELLTVSARREIVTGIKFPKQPDVERRLESSFRYEATEDQDRAISHVYADMEDSRPMDRLVCGDVGFGKTEVAMRAAAKAAAAGKQVAVLSPTTILAEQHLATFTKRLGELGFKVAGLSRFKSQAEQQQTLKELADGKVDIVIGTHRMLSPDVVFKDLGLLVIDEEQRFGVRHKERLKKLRAQVDVVSLSATPIPRTLNLALSGLREISTINTPPSGRRPIEQTFGEYDEKLIDKVITEELARGGQVYFLHNRVATIQAAAKELRARHPKLKIDVGHGQMTEDELADVMARFAGGEIDLLVCTTIVENGLDLANANTMIIDDVATLGLSQSYQLRGRIGRGSRQGRAFFFYKAGSLSATARQRLRSLKNAKELGSGFQVALEDLEIRGAGNVLGKEQSGNVRAVGLTLYSKVLSRAVEELESGERFLETELDLPVEAAIPVEVVPDETERLRYYQAVSNAADLPELADIAKRLRATAPKWPEELDHLFRMQAIRLSGARVGIVALRYTALPGTNRSARVGIAELAHPLSDEKAADATAAGWEITPTRLSKSIDKDKMLEGVESLLQALDVLPAGSITKPDAVAAA